ncbi:MAG: UDP-N-acetylmuramoyl-tripeptide--D-alanyl-D-alanine ligase [Chitinophagales bacterium]|jgi:UDP-N-acetylmuramoyl-tripeptide--D-alanyl-D-alanine ligase
MIIKELHQLFLKSKGVCTDTRSLERGQLFFALKGGNFNGNAYAQKALDGGASLAVVDEEEYFLEGKTILVENALETLQELAKFHRLYLDIPIIAITGSNGKTTTKELLHRILLQQYNCYATKGNLNNHIGVPLSLLSMTKKHDLAIIEMGANHQGEIDAYCQWALPDFGLITNIGKAHLEGFGGIEGVIKGKTELYRSLAERDGLIFYNAEDVILTEQSRLVDERLSYGQSGKVDYLYTLLDESEFIGIEVNGLKIQSNLIGQYNGVNMAAAAAIGQYLKVPLKKMKSALESYEPDNNRSQMIKYGDNQVILDAYNANPTSMMAALSYFEKLNVAKKGVFLGDMFEVGTSSNEEHQLLVKYLAKSNFDFHVLVGEHFFAQKDENGLFFKTTEEAKEWLSKEQFEGYTFLVKGSRGMRMEIIL